VRGQRALVGDEPVEAAQDRPDVLQRDLPGNARVLLRPGDGIKPEPVAAQGNGEPDLPP